MRNTFFTPLCLLALIVGFMQISQAQNLTVEGDGYFNSQVGIGTMSPNLNALLDVRGGARVRSAHIYAHTTPYGQGAYIGWNRISGFGRTMIASQRGAGFGGFEFITYNQDNTIRDISMTITGDGEVGIGTENPTAKLDLRGDFYMVNNRNSIFWSNRSDSDFDIIQNGTSTKRAFSIHAGTNGDDVFSVHPKNGNGDFIQGLYVKNGTGNVGIGTDDPASKLHVVGEGTALRSISTGTGTVRSIYAEASGELQSSVSTGVRGTAIGFGTLYAIYGYTSGFTVGNYNGYGVVGYVDSGGGDKFGVYGSANHATGIKYGVYGVAGGDIVSNLYAGYFSGNLRYTGTLTGPSDKKLKRDISTIKETISLIKQLKPVTYDFDQQNYSYMHLPQGKHFGFIAQELEKVLPELVEETVHPGFSKEEAPDSIATPEVRYKSINYIELIPLLTKAIQEQQTELEKKEERIKKQENTVSELRSTNNKLQEEVDDLKTRLAQIEALLQGNTVDRRLSTENLTLTDARLEQNQPNPFTENTLIRYYIPEGITKAELRITNVAGKVLKDIAIPSRGQGQTQLEAQSLNAGNYFYTLILDGRMLETKQMVLTKN